VDKDLVNYLNKAGSFHLDPDLPLSREDIEHLKPGTIARLRRNGRAHMGRARKINVALKAINDNISDPKFKRALIEIEDFDPIEVYEEHNWTCPHCFRRVDVTKGGRDPDSCVLGHMINFAHSGGHTRRNCGPWHYSCNAAVASVIETPREAKIRRHRRAAGELDGEADYKPRKKLKIQGRSFGASNGGSRWPKRKLPSRGFQKRKK